MAKADSRSTAGTLRLAVLALAAAAAGAASAQPPPLDGRWDVMLDRAAPTGIRLFLETDGTRVSGRREAGGVTRPVAGEIHGDRVVFGFTVLEGGLEVPVEIRARLTAGRLDGESTLALPGGRSVSREWSAVRAGDTADISGDAAAAPSSPGSHPASPLAELLRATLERTGWPGVTVAWRRGDGTAGAEAVGLADLETGSPMTAESRMPAGSVGKTFVAAVTLGLAAEGAVDLDAPVAAVLGDRPWFDRVPNARDLTLRLLLQHGGGLPDHVDDPDFAALAPKLVGDPERPLPPEAAIATVAGDPPLCAAGECYHYSDTGYLLVGLVLEEVTGRTWWELLRQRALEPAGLEHSHPQDRRDFPRLATGYPGSRFVEALPPAVTSAGALVFHPGTEWTGGGVVSTAPDLARWGSLLYGGRFLPGAALDEMLASRAPGSSYGLGVQVASSARGPFWGHDGWFPGYRTKLAYFPRQDLAVAIQVNTDRGVDLHRLLLDVLAVLEPAG